MAIFSRLWRGRGRGESEAARAQARLTELLRTLQDGADAGTVVQTLDESLEELLAHDHEEEVLALIARVDGELAPDVWSAPGRLAQLAGLHYRLPGDRVARCRRALELYEQAVEGHRHAGTTDGLAAVLGRMGQARVELGAAGDRESYQRAIPLLEEALGKTPEGEPAQRAALCRTLGEAYGGLVESGPDHLELARERLESALRLYEQAGLVAEQADVESRLGDVLTQLLPWRGKDELEAALRRYDSAATLYAQAQLPRPAAACHERTAEAHLSLSIGADEHLAAAQEAFQRALEAYQAVGAPTDAARMRARLAWGQLSGPHASDPEVLGGALEHLVAALHAFEEQHMEHERAFVLRGLARIYLSPGAGAEDVDQGVRMLEEAADYYSRASLSADYQAVHEQLRRARVLRARNAAL